MASADGGLRRVVVRADPSVAQARLRLTSGEQLMLAPLGIRPDVSVMGRSVAARSAQVASTRAKVLPRVDLAKVLAAAEIGHPPDAAGAALPRTSIMRRRERHPVEEKS